jgi:hypothetical protein
MKWKHFSQFLGHFTGAKPPGLVISTLDGRVTHPSDHPALQKALTNDDSLLCSLPHCTQKLQPLDVACFDVLKVFCNDASETYV